MRVEINNLLFDDNEEDCFYELASTNGEQFAFVQVLDLGSPSARLSKPIKKQYWGRWEGCNKEASVLQIMSYGGKLPNLERFT